jgi:hypothetical protein
VDQDERGSTRIAALDEALRVHDALTVADVITPRASLAGQRARSAPAAGDRAARTWSSVRTRRTSSMSAMTWLRAASERPERGSRGRRRSAHDAMRDSHALNEQTVRRAPRARFRVAWP